MSFRDQAMGERMTESVFESFGRIVDLAKSEGVDFMVVAGDAFDESTITPATRHRFASELRRLGVPCFIARGNHDPHTSWESSIPYPDNVHEFGTEPEYIELEGLDGVEIVGVSFEDWHEERNLPSMVRGSPDKFTIACMHCDVDSAGAQYDYSPCRLTDMLGRGVDYWAIGHVHKRAVLCEDPYVVYPGNIQGRKITESGEKGCYLVTVDDGRVSELRFVPTQGMVWRDVLVDISGKSMDGVISEVRGEVAAGDVVRITFTGSGELDSMLRLHTAENEEYLSKVLGCTVCGLVLETTPDIDMDARASGSDMTAKVIAAGRSMASSDRDAIISVITSNPIAARHRDYFESLPDERLSELAEAATGFLVARLEGSR